MLSARNKKRSVPITPLSLSSTRFHTPVPPPILTPSVASTNSENVHPNGSDTVNDLFIFSPFGLCCRRFECRRQPLINLTLRSIQIHLKKHGMDSTKETVNAILKGYKEEVKLAKESGSIDCYCYSEDGMEYYCYSCRCGENFKERKDSALRHCKNTGCNPALLQKVSAVKLCCGRYVTQQQIDAFLGDTGPVPTGSPVKTTTHFDFENARKVLEPFLRDSEEHEDTYTHMYFPFIKGCCDSGGFEEKVIRDMQLMNLTPNSITEEALVRLHEKAEEWLVQYAKNYILMVPGNLRAALQTFEGVEVNEVSQRHTYTMQHKPKNIWPELRKLLSFAYRRGRISPSSINANDDFDVVNIITDLLLETTHSVAQHPFLVEFCLMSSFRQQSDGSISMISCDTVSSNISKISSACKAAVCTMICTFTEHAFTVHGPALIEKVRMATVINILSPYVRQIREMNERIPKRRKRTQDENGNINVDGYNFSFETWSRIVPMSLEMLEHYVEECADVMEGQRWWECIVDMCTPVNVHVDRTTSDLVLVGVEAFWKVEIKDDCLDMFTALMEMALHGFGGGSARAAELERHYMSSVLWHNGTIYYIFDSIKKFNHASKGHIGIQRKLPPIIGRYYLLYRSLVQNKKSLFDNVKRILPSRKDRTMTARHVVKDLFNLDSLPDMMQIRHLWAGVTNWLNIDFDDKYVTSNETGALKMGHTVKTHSMKYSSMRIGCEETHFNAYHCALGDTSHSWKLQADVISLSDIREAMKVCHPSSDPSKAHFLSIAQKELVEYGYGHGAVRQHCIGLLAPGEGKSDCYLIPTIARRLSNKSPKVIVHVSPYKFLAAYQYANACSTIHHKLHQKDVRITLFSSSDILEGQLPVELEDDTKLPSLVFINLDGMYNLFYFHLQVLKTWIELGLLDRIVIDEVHSLLTEISFRPKYKVYQRLPSLGIPIIALSGSLPPYMLSKFSSCLGLSICDQNSDIKIIHGGDITGSFPKGFKIRVDIANDYRQRAATFVRRVLGCQPVRNGAVHIFVADKPTGAVLFDLLPQYNCCLVTSDTPTIEQQLVAEKWSKGVLDVLISTTVALVGTENPKCKFLVCAGYLYDNMQVVQAIGRLRNFQRKPDGQIYFAVPTKSDERRLTDDKHRFHDLCNRGFLVADDETKLFKYVLTSAGVERWCRVASEGKRTCALKWLSNVFAKQRALCGACLYCQSSSTTLVQEHAVARIQMEAKAGSATERVLRRLEHQCLACQKSYCRGFPLLRGKESRYLPENKDICFNWNSCFKCGISTHDRRQQCRFDKTFMNNKTCSECWVFKGVPGYTHHDHDKCPVKGRLRRLLSYHYIQTNLQRTKTFEQYICSIYTSPDSFSAFMATMEKVYMNTKRT